MSKPAARKPIVTVSGYETSLVRSAIAVLLVLVGIVWIFVYTRWAMDAANFTDLPGIKKPDTPFPWMSDLRRWNYVIGFGLIFLGLAVSAHKKTPLLPPRPDLDRHLLLRGSGRLRAHPGHGPARAVQPLRRHRLHGGGVHVRDEVGVTRSGADVMRPARR